MRYARENLKWNGWGWKETEFDFEGSESFFWPYLMREVGLKTLRDTPAVALEALEIPPSRLTPEQLGELQGFLDPTQIKTDTLERVFHARGHSLRDLLELRSGKLESAPDAVIYPRKTTELEKLIAFAQSHHWALIPFGGGTSVVGGINPETQIPQHGVLTLDLTWMNHLLDFDPISQTATFEAGIYGPEVEDILNPKGYTVGHTPQSFEFSTVGGWVAARGAGSASNRYGKVEEMLVAAKVLTPTGVLEIKPCPASAAGPDLRQILAGSEGALGIITQATLKIHPLPSHHDARGFLFRDFTSGITAIRDMVQHGVPTAMIRLSDENETQFLFQFKKKPGNDSPFQQMMKKWLSWQGYTQTPALMLIGLEGEAWEVEPHLKVIKQKAVAAEGFALGSKAGESWHKSRYSTPYLRDALLNRGVAVETLETATTWANLETLYHAVKNTLQTTMDQTLQGIGAKGVVMTHISHCYSDGASLYFTFVFPLLPGEELTQYQAIKEAACNTIIQHGGTISHHHGVGKDHARWLRQEKGALGLGMLQAMRQYLDPQGLMNPGKWL